VTVCTVDRCSVCLGRSCHRFTGLQETLTPTPTWTGSWDSIAPWMGRIGMIPSASALFASTSIKTANKWGRSRVS
jgi:hypothetical protein